VTLRDAAAACRREKILTVSFAVFRPVTVTPLDAATGVMLVRGAAVFADAAIFARQASSPLRSWAPIPAVPGGADVRIFRRNQQVGGLFSGCGRWIPRRIPWPVSHP
jgi:hypothetical protein